MYWRNPWWFWLLTFAAVTALVYLPASGPQPLRGAQSNESRQTSAFKITFGLRQKGHGRNWAGSLQNPAQIRAISGWHLDDSDTLHPPQRWDLSLGLVAGDVAAKGIILDVMTPEEQPVTFFTRYGDVKFVPAEVPYGKIHHPDLVAWGGASQQGDIAVERVPRAQVVSGNEYEDDDPALLRTRGGEYWLAWVAYKTRRRQGYFLAGADEIMVARSRDGLTWSRPESITPPGDHFRVALGEDRRGHIWCIYALQKDLESGNFDLYARKFDAQRWSDELALTKHPLPDVFHKVATDARGDLYLTWMGFRPSREGGRPQSDILLRVLAGDQWSPEINVSESVEDDWEPAIAASSAGQAWIAWDSYRSTGGDPANYDLLLRSISGDQLGPLREVSSTPLAEMRADVAVDGEGGVWVAWEEGGVNWGKDTGYKNAAHGIHLREGGTGLYSFRRKAKEPLRRPRVAVLQGDRLMQPQVDLGEAYPAHLRKELFQNPRLAVAGDGRVWVLLRHQLILQGRNGGHLFDFYATTLEGRGAAAAWINPILLPASTGRQDTVLAVAAGEGTRLALAVAGDKRRMPVGLPLHNDVAALVLDARGVARGQPEFVPFQPTSVVGPVPVVHPDEEAEVERIRNHRVHVGGEAYKIVRGDLHRHTEISMDGATDGILWDCYRYALNAAAFDFIGVTDHNYGARADTDKPEGPNSDDEYQWWRTQKSADIFHVPGRFVPLYGYERSVRFPLGHRNIFHSYRGVFSYRVPTQHVTEYPGLVEQDARGLWNYLRQTDGIGIPHTSGTSMGTDWRLRDDELMPVTEIYQGDRNSYEEENAPRAARADKPGPGFAGREPFQKGLVWNALGVGYRMGFIASSDHWSTHISYANVIVPDGVTTREDIQDALRNRRTYASTDNIIVDFHTADTMQGGELAASESPRFLVRVQGTEPMLKVDVIKNNRVIYTRHPSQQPEDATRLAFEFRDLAAFGGDFADTSMGASSQIQNWDDPETGIRPRPTLPESYYYVRVLQSFSTEQPDIEGEIAWSSPIFIRRSARTN